ncbi:MAG TPA: hypothetical protein VGS97_09835 [Actinocrinis sp.]|uniref:hypothetical protein n=1 Tax=Actinocrinis sp. TaxID=1920516 RepID=UPI002DDC9B68|nr:hypothetical protein [Actinocrinis sp.]HEV2344380.1 hypothetical protein [Actinocrinis sp.]
MVDGTVKVTAEAEMHIHQLAALLNGPLTDVLNQIVAHGLALTDPNVWAGQAASIFANEVWPQVQSLLSQVNGSLNQVQSQVAGVLASVTAAGSGGIGVDVSATAGVGVTVSL